METTLGRSAERTDQNTAFPAVFLMGNGPILGDIGVSPILDTAPAAAAHHDHLMRGHLAKRQPPIPLFSSDSMRTKYERSHPASILFMTHVRKPALLASRAPHVYGRHPARAKAQSRARLASPRNIPRSASLDGAPDARARPYGRTHEQLSSQAPISLEI